MTVPSLSLSREQILRFRRTTGGLDQRVRPGRRSLRRAAWAGLQDSMPRAASLAISARVEGTGPDVWEDPAVVQVWGPRFSVHVVPRRDLAIFTLGRLPDEARALARAEDLAARLHDHLAGRTLPFGEAGRALGGHPNQLRYAAATGTVLLRWDGVAQPTVWTEPRPDIDPIDARSDLVRRYLHIHGPSTAEAFATWAGVHRRSAEVAFERLRRSLVPVRTPIGDAWLLRKDVDLASRDHGTGPQADDTGNGAVRLLPSGDPYWLLHGDDRVLLVPDPERRAALWTPRVWPGAILAGGEIVGTWRRSGRRVTVAPWKRLPTTIRRAVEAEAAALPLPDPGDTTVEWVGP